MQHRSSPPKLTLVPPLPPEPPEGPADPEWVRPALARVWRGLRLYFLTVAAFTRGPARFVTEWVDGRRTVMNPLGYFATSVALVSAGVGLVTHLDPEAHAPASLHEDVLNTLQ